MSSSPAAYGTLWEADSRTVQRSLLDDKVYIDVSDHGEGQ